MVKGERNQKNKGDFELWGIVEHSASAGQLGVTFAQRSTGN